METLINQKGKSLKHATHVVLLLIVLKVKEEIEGM